jgi:hypothetical protein
VAAPDGAAAGCMMCVQLCVFFCFMVFVPPLLLLLLLLQGG